MTTQELFAHRTYPDGCWASYFSDIDGEEVRMGYRHIGGKNYGYKIQPFQRTYNFPESEYYNKEKDEEYNDIMMPKFQAWLDSIGINRS
jgi:hypothetical protein